MTDGAGGGGGGALDPREAAEVVIFGTGEMARLLHFYLTHDSHHRVVAFTVDAERRTQTSLFGVPVVPFETLEATHPPDRFAVLVAMLYGDANRRRADAYARVRAKGYRLVSYVSSRATTWPGLVLGDNCVVLEGSVVQPFATVGNDVVLACGSIVGHDSVIEDHCFLAPGAVTLGFVRVGALSFLGANSTVRDATTIGRECVIGAGVTIRRDAGPRQVFPGEHAEPAAQSADSLRQLLTWAR